MDLAPIHETIVQEARELVGVVASAAPLPEIGTVYEDLSDHFRALGICHLLVHADVDAFRENLTRSAAARIDYLRRAQAESLGPCRHRALGRSDALLDALAARSWSQACEIRALSDQDWTPSGEYEDDHAYLAALARVAADQARASDATDLESACERFERALEGQASTRLDVCRALACADADAYAGAVVSLMTERSEALESAREGRETYDILFWPQSFVSSEGLGLIQLGGLLGWSLPPRIPLCPDPARFADVCPEYDDVIAAVRAAAAG